MTSVGATTRKRGRYASDRKEAWDWESMFDELGEFPEHGAITRVARRHGVHPRTLNSRCRIYRDALRANDVNAQWAMLGYCDRRRDNRRGLSGLEEKRVVTDLLLTSPPHPE